MGDTLRQWRREATQLAIRQAIAVTAVVPSGLQASVVRSLAAAAARLPMLRRKVLENMRLALGPDVPVEAAKLYFEHLGWLLSRSLWTFHRGIAATSVAREVIFDDTIRVLDDAVAEGRGVVLAAPHCFGHELVAALINRRHPMAMLVRQSPTADRMKRKLKWYNALGVEIVLRPDGASTMKDAVAYLRILKRGKLLALTPDLLADSGQGIAARIFGRPTQLHGGAFALAIAARAPVIRVSERWQSDSSLLILFDRAPAFPDIGDRDAAMRAAVAEWCDWLEEKLRANPENWLFWLDKRWSRFLRKTPAVE